MEPTGPMAAAAIRGLMKAVRAVASSQGLDTFELLSETTTAVELAAIVDYFAFHPDEGSL